jgi:hypothetical protein
MASILGDTGDERCRIRESIAMVMTTGSVVFRPETAEAWIGTGDTPTSHGRFEPFSLRTQDHEPAAGALEVGSAIDETQRAAFERYRRAYVSYLEEEDLVSARHHIAEAVDLAPEQPVYHFVKGVMALQAADARTAEASLDAAIALGHPDPERVAAFHLFRGRARDLAGDRKGALADYRTCIGHYADPPVHAAARKNMKRPYARRSLGRLRLDMSLGDVISP